MEPPRIKFCGITRPEDAEHAVSLQAWAIGLIFHPGSPRRCELPAAIEIGQSHRRHMEVVGVWVNPSIEEVARTAEQVGLTAVQLHGDEGPAFCSEVARRTGARVIKAARVRSGADIQAVASFHTDFHLLDSYVPGTPGGTGETFAWELARRHRTKVPLILSGGLTPENVEQAARAVRPFAVDVASGIERAPGIKDHTLMDAFAERARAATETPSEQPSAA